MNGQGLIDPAFCGRLCLTLLHSAWQIALVAIAATAIERLCQKQSAEWRYALHVTALLAGLTAIPLTYVILNLAQNNNVAPIQMAALATAPRRESASAADATLNAAKRVEAAGRADSSLAAPSAAPATRPWPQAASWIAAAYMIGVALMLVRLIAAAVKANRLGARARPLADGPLVETIQSLARAWSMSAAPALAEAERIVAPKVVGLVRPTILLPASAVSGLSAEELQMILVHELAHVRRHDMWIVLFQRLSESVLFYNPALWHLSRRISTLREYCCDDIACKTDRNPKPQLRYAAALLRLVELGAPEIGANETLTALAASGRSPSELRRRVARLLGEPLREPVRLTRGAVLALVMFAALLALGPAFSTSQAQPANSAAAAQQQEAQQKTEGPAVDAKHRFSFGGAVEVVALGTHGEEPHRWWDAQGKLLESVLFTWKKYGEVASGEAVWRRIVLRIRDLPDDADVTWSIPGSHAYAGGEVTVDGQKAPKGYFTRYFAVSADQKTVGIKVGVATGPWTTAATAQPFGASALGLPMGKSLVFSDSLETAEGTIVIVSHNYFDQDFRLVAVDKHGTSHASLGRGGYSAGDIYQAKGTFPGLKRSDIDRFEFQIREYEFIEVEGLPINPQENSGKLR